VGVEDKVRQLYSELNSLPLGDKNQRDAFVPNPLWTGTIVHPARVKQWNISQGRIGDHYYQDATVYAHGLRKDVSLSVHIDRTDAQPMADCRTVECRQREEPRRPARELELAAQIRPQVESWMKVLAKTIDDLDTPGAPVATTPPPERKPAAPPPPTSTTQVPPPTKPTAQQLFARPTTVIGGRVERWWTNTREDIEDYAAARPTRWAGDCYMASGLAITVLGVFVPGPGWVLFGGGLFTAGAILHHSDRSTPPPELAVVREAREKLERYQKDWTRGFSDAQLNELGIFMDDLSKLTREQRQQVYRDADIDFTSRAEAFRQMREAEAQERKGPGR
jgi:hypothetical protein